MEDAVTQGGPSNRRFPRMPVECVTLVSRIDEQSLTKYTTTRSIGLGGCSIEFDRPLEVGSVVRLFLAVGYVAMKAVGRVVYSRQLESGHYEVGFEFVEIAPKDLGALAWQFRWDEPDEPSADTI